MQRAAREHARAQRQRQRWQALAHARGVPAAAVAANRFRKQRRVGGCGNARCWLCHGDKLAKRPTPPARRAAARFADGLRELGETRS